MDAKLERNILAIDVADQLVAIMDPKTMADDIKRLRENLAKICTLEEFKSFTPEELKSVIKFFLIRDLSRLTVNVLTNGDSLRAISGEYIDIEKMEKDLRFLNESYLRRGQVEKIRNYYIKLRDSYRAEDFLGLFAKRVELHKIRVQMDKEVAAVSNMIKNLEAFIENERENTERNKTLSPQLVGVKGTKKKQGNKPKFFGAGIRMK